MYDVVAAVFGEMGRGEVKWEEEEFKRHQKQCTWNTNASLEYTSCTIRNP